MQRVSALWQASPQKLVGALVVLMMAAMMAVASGASFTSTSANVGNVVTAGTLSHSNSTDTILNVSKLMPGKSASGTVTLGNTGDGDGVFSLTKSNLVDSDPTRPLSAKLDLLVEDVTDPLAPVVRYNGKLGAMGTRAMGTIAPGGDRTYKFTVTFPDGGLPSGPDAGDNVYKNASTTVDYNWESVSN
jgi:spore coat-associated protein N